jgi:hypothetical protein
MKPLVLLVLLALFPAARAEENRYDLLAKTITPFLSVFARDSKSDDRAFSLKARIEQGTDLPEELRGTKTELTLQAPDKLRLRGPLFGENYTLVRDGDRVWIAPGTVARELLDASSDKLPPPEKKFKLGNFQLPFPEKQLKLLTALLSVKDVGIEAIDGTECRVLDVTLMPELAKSFEAQGWIARLWITADHKPARITLARKGWNIVLRIDELDFAPDFPSSTWAPAPSEDVLELKPSDYSRFLRAIGGGR